MPNHPQKKYDIKPRAIIGQILLFLQTLCLWPSENDLIFRKIVKFVQVIILVFFVTLLGAGAALSDNMNEAISLASTSIGAFLMLVKLTYVLSKKKEVLTFLQDICEHSVVDYNEFTEIDKKLDNFAIFGYCNLLSMFLSVSGFIIISLPVFSSERRLPLNIAFPWDWKTSDVAFWTAFLIAILGVTICGTKYHIMFHIYHIYTKLNCRYCNIFYNYLLVCDVQLFHKIPNIGKPISKYGCSWERQFNRFK